MSLFRSPIEPDSSVITDVLEANDSSTIQPLQNTFIKRNTDTAEGTSSITSRGPSQIGNITTAIYASVNFTEKHAKRRERLLLQNEPQRPSPSPSSPINQRPLQAADLHAQQDEVDVKSLLNRTSDTAAITSNILTVGDYEDIREFQISTSHLADNSLRFDSDNDEQNDEHIYEPINVRQDIFGGSISPADLAKPSNTTQSSYSSKNVWQRYFKRIRLMDTLLDVGVSKTKQPTSATTKRSSKRKRRECSFITQFRKLWSNNNSSDISTSTAASFRNEPSSSSTLTRRNNRLCGRSDDDRNNIVKSPTQLIEPSKPSEPLPVFDPLGRIDRQYIMDARNRFLQSCLLATDENNFNHSKNSFSTPAITSNNSNQKDTIVVLQLELRKKLAIREKL